MKDLTIRRAAADDRADWSRLWDAYLAFYETARPAAQHDQTWGRIMDADAPLHCLLAERDGQIIGLANYLFHPGFWDAADLCYLNDLYVSPDARGSGVGAALIEATTAHAHNKGAAEVYWLTAEDNTTARALYDRVAQRSGFLHYMKG